MSLSSILNSRIVQRALNVGVSVDDSGEMVRQKHVLLVVHYAVMSVGPTSSALIFLLSSMPWIALLTLAIAIIPITCSFFYYCCCGNIKWPTWVATLVPLIAPFIITFAGGGIQNSGYIANLILASPLVWLCITRKWVIGIALFHVGIVMIIILSSIQDNMYHWMVDLAYTVRPTSPTLQLWLWLCNVVLLQSLNLLFFGYTTSLVTAQVKQLLTLQFQLEELARKLVRLDLDDIPQPNKQTASVLELRLFEMVEKIRVWKPFIPATLFMDTDSLVHENTILEHPLNTEDPLPSLNVVAPSRFTLYAPKVQAVCRKSATSSNSLESLESGIPTTHMGVITSPDSTMISQPLKFNDRRLSSLSARNTTSSNSNCATTPRGGGPSIPSTSSRGSVQGSVIEKSGSYVLGKQSFSLSPSTKPVEIAPSHSEVNRSRHSPNLSQWAAVTIAIIHSTGFPLKDSPAMELHQLFSVFLNNTHRCVMEERGALHQFYGDTVVCVWSGANQQLRACRSVLHAISTIESVIGTVKLRCAITTGSMFVGNIGEQQCMPCFYGLPQMSAQQLISLGSMIGGKVLVDPGVLSQVQCLCDAIPVDIIVGPSFLSPTPIYELCGFSQSSINSPDEWMYEITGPKSSVDFLKDYFDAFSLLEHGSVPLANSAFQALLNSSHEDDPAAFSSKPIVQHHLQRLSKTDLCTGNSTASNQKGWKPVRRAIIPWTVSYSSHSVNNENDAFAFARHIE